MLDDKKQKELIGRLERVSLPEFGLENIEAKIDTGAYSGAIHVSEAYEEKIGEDTFLKFILLDEEHPNYNKKTFTAKNFEKKVVKNSNGSEIRYLIPVKLILKNKEFDVRLSLTNRKEMRYPILIGRKIIKKHFVVDAAKKYTN